MKLSIIIPIYNERETLLKRKRECRKCGRCCLLNKSWCHHFKDGKCEVYDNQPFFCRIYPIDYKDMRMSDPNKECGYSWDEDD